mmetsp:Transcript_5429/g.13589  ORF Transcript_5429/g.13589 Transcript_5429/m.13589 type:complete len:737 (-) Transcript_5429:63-2273(-)
MPFNNAPSNPQDKITEEVFAPPKGPVRVSNVIERDADCSSSSALACGSTTSSSSLPKTAHSVLFRNNGVSGGSRVRRASRDRSNFWSSLRTIESGAASSLDIYDDDEDDDLHSSQGSSCSSSIHQAVKRRHSLEMNGSSARSLMVSFSRLNEYELTHLRKWNRRLHRTEVFDKYYFPAKWEASEMEALARFLKLEDPTAKMGVGLRGGSLRGSGKKPSTNENGNRKARQTSMSWQSGERGDGGLSSSITSSFKDSAEKLSKLLVDPKQNSADPAKVTKLALEFIFFPFVHDPKSVLLKRGSIFLHDDSLPNERELMIFTHGFLLGNVVLEDAFNLFLALSDREFLTERSLLDYLQNKFREMDEEESGEIEKWKLQNLFTDMGIPMGKSILDELIQRGIIPTNPCGQCEKVNWEALHKALQGVFVQQNKVTSPQSLGLDDSNHKRDLLGGGGETGGLKKLLGAFQKVKKNTNVEFASLYKNVARVDSLDISHGDDSVSREIANSVYAQISFSVTMNDRKNDPLIVVCSKPEHRDSWVEAFKPGVVRALTKSSSNAMSELRSKLGWQYMVIRSTFTSLVVLNDIDALECLCQEKLNGERSNDRKLRLELNSLDEYNGYSPLHYATVLGHTDCMKVLLEAGSKVTLDDREGLSPMYHALSLRNDEVANVLENFGADRSDDLRKLIAQEIQAEELKNACVKHESSRLETHVENKLDLESSERSENIDALLMQAANQFKGK